MFPKLSHPERTQDFFPSALKCDVWPTQVSVHLNQAGVLHSDDEFIAQRQRPLQLSNSIQMKQPGHLNRTYSSFEFKLDQRIHCSFTSLSQLSRGSCLVTYRHINISECTASGKLSYNFIIRWLANLNKFRVALDEFSAGKHRRHRTLHQKSEGSASITTHPLNGVKCQDIVAILKKRQHNRLMYGRLLTGRTIINTPSADKSIEIPL